MKKNKLTLIKGCAINIRNYRTQKFQDIGEVKFKMFKFQNT